MFRPLPWFAGALAVGIVLAHWVRPDPVLPAVFLITTLVAGGLGFYYRSQARIVIPALLAAVLAFGAWRYAHVRAIDPGPLADLLDHTVTITGTVKSSRYRADSDRWSGLVSVQSVSTPDGATVGVRGQVWAEARWRGGLTVWAAESPPPGSGRRVQLRGRLDLPPAARYPGAYDQREQLARQGVFLYLRADGQSGRVLGPINDLGWGDTPLWTRWATATRQRLAQTLHRQLSEKEAGLLVGLLLGDRGGVPGDWLEDFKNSGVVHLLAVSGAHVGALAAGLMWLFSCIGMDRLRAGPWTLPFLLVYCLVTGAAPSVVRATVMAAYFFGGRAFLRGSDGYSSLAAAAITQLVIAPGLLFDPGFQLSFGATWGLVAFGTPITRGMRRLLHARLAGGLAMTLAASAGVLPLLLAHFSQFSVISPLTNLMVAPMALVLVPLGLAIVPVVSLLPVLGMMLKPLGWMANLLALTSGAMAHVPGAVMDLRMAPWVGIFWYAGLVGWHWRGVLSRAWAEGWARLRVHVHGSQGTTTAIVAAATFISLVVYGSAVVAPVPTAGLPAPLTVHFLNVGQGDATLVGFPGGEKLLVDAGWADDRDTDADYGRQVVLPALRRLGVDTLNIAAISHADQDHAGGMPAVVSGLPVGEIWEPGVGGSSGGYGRLLSMAGNLGIPVRTPQMGEVYRFGPATITVVHPGKFPVPGAAPDDTNAYSLVLRISYGAFALLLTGDLTPGAEATLLARRAPLGATVLKVAHHGSPSSTTVAFLAAVQPELAVISVGSNSYGHPAPAVLGRLRQLNIPVVRTDRQGEVMVITDGRSLVVRTAYPGTPHRAVRLMGAW